MERLFLPSLWVSVIYAHVYWCLSDGPSHCLLSSTISSQMNHQRTNWGMSLWICNIYWGYASLWTSPLASLTRKKQMVRGHGMFGHWNTRVSWCFLCFSAHLFYILFRDYSRPPFVQDVKAVLSKCNSQLRVRHDLLTPTKSLIYRVTSLWRDTASGYFALSCTEAACWELCFLWNSSYQSNSPFLGLYCSVFLVFFGFFYSTFF